MAKIDALFVLIQSLSRSEKRYFRVFTNTKRCNNYLKLFDQMEKMEDYDESFIKKKFRNEKFIKQLHVTKNYLCGLIYKNNRNFHAKENKTVRIRNLLINAEILFNKELFEHCNKELIKAEKMASEYELFNYLIEIYDWKRKLEQQKDPQNYPLFKEILEEQSNALEKLNNQNKYVHLIVDVSSSIVGENKVAGEELLDDVSNALSVEARVMHYNARYFRNIQNSEREGGFDDLNKLVQYFDDHPKWIVAKPGTYISTINNLITYYVFKKNSEEALSLIDKAKKVYKQIRPTSENKSLMKQILRTYNIELEVYRDQHLYEENRAIINNTERFVKKYQFKMPKDYLISFWFQFANIRFMQHDQHSALKWVNEIIQMNFRDIRLDIQIQARFLNLLVHLEQKNMFVLRYFVDSTRRFVGKRKAVEPFEKVLLSFFSRMGRIPETDFRQEYIKLNSTLFPSGKEPLVSEDFLDYVDYQSWLREKISNH